jgi:hypothetical protein
MSNTDTKVTDLSTEQQKAIIDTKEVLASKQDVLMAIGQVQAFNNIKKYTTVGELLIFKKIKESKQYKGLVYENDSGKSTTVGDIKELCTVFFQRSYNTMQEELNNLEIFGEEFLESSQNMGLGNRELRKLRQLPENQQLAVIASKEVDLGDKTAVKELIEDLVIQHNTEKTELTKRVKEADQVVKAARANSSDKQQELDKIKEQEAIRQFSQEAWHRDALDSVNALIEARAVIAKGTNQLITVLNNLSENHELDSKSIDLIGRSLLSEAKYNVDLVNEVANDVFAILGDKYHPDLTADDLFNQLHSNNHSDAVDSAE